MFDIEKYLKQLETLVNIDCGSYNPEGIWKVANLLIDWYKEIGWYVKIHETNEASGPVLEISNHPDCEYYDAMFIGHMDTVFPDGTVKQRPFRREGNFCYGPGTEDMKNGDLAMLHIAENLPEEVSQRLNICMCYNSDEEISSVYSQKYTKAIADKSNRLFVMESAQLDGGHVFQRKGRTVYEINFIGKAGHAGYMFVNENASAINELGNFIYHISKLLDKDKDTTLNIGLVNGGTAVNVVADKAYVKLESRYKLLSEKERIEKAVEGYECENPDVKMEIIYKDPTDPWNKTPEGNEFIAWMSKIAEKENIEFIEKDRGGLSDANHLSENCKIILDGMGPRGRYPHSVDEFMTIDSVEPCVRLFVKTLSEL